MKKLWRLQWHGRCCLPSRPAAAPSEPASSPASVAEETSEPTSEPEEEPEEEIEEEPAAGRTAGAVLMIAAACVYVLYVNPRFMGRKLTK